MVGLLKTKELNDAFVAIAEDPDFLVFSQPVCFYGALSTRQPLYLQRTVCYSERSPCGDHAANTKEHIQLKLYKFRCVDGTAIRIDPCFMPAPTHLSVFAIVSQAATQENEFRPLLARLLHLNRNPQQLAESSPVEHSNAWIDFGLPVDASQDLQLLLIVQDSHPECTFHSSAKDTFKALYAGWRSSKLFGCIPDGSNIWWGSLTLDGSNQSGSMVHLQRAVLKQVPCIEWGGQSSATAKQDAHTFALHGSTHAGESKAWKEASLHVDLAWGAPAKGTQFAQQASRKRKRMEEAGPKYREYRRARAMPVVKEPVLFRYHLRDPGKVLDEVKYDMGCAFCTAICNSAEALRLHINACHTCFDLELERVGHGPAAPQGTCILHVYVRSDVYNENGYYQPPGFGISEKRLSYFHHFQDYSRKLEELINRPHSHFQPKSFDVAAKGKGASGEENGAGSRNDDVSHDASHGSSARGEQQRRRSRVAPKRPADRAPAEVLERSYFHSKTAMPMPAADIEAGMDSDDDMDFALWEKCQQLDLCKRKGSSPEAKRIVLMWNTFAYSHPVHADYFVPPTCERFAARHAAELRAPAMRNAFGNHLLAFWEYALIDWSTLERCLRIVDGKVPAVGPAATRRPATWAGDHGAGPSTGPPPLPPVPPLNDVRAGALQNTTAPAFPPAAAIDLKGKAPLGTPAIPASATLTHSENTNVVMNNHMQQ